MGYTFNGGNRTITLTSGTTSFSTNDLYSRWKDWVLAGNAKWLKAFETDGGTTIEAGQTSGFYLYLTNGWSIIPDNTNHTLTVVGNLIRFVDDTSGVPVFQAVSSSVLILQKTSVIAIGYSTGGGSSITTAEIWSHPNRTLTDKNGFALSTDANTAIATAVNSALSDDFAATYSVVLDIQAALSGGITAGLTPTQSNQLQSIFDYTQLPYLD